MVRAYGEMVLLWERGNTTRAILLEEMWNELAKNHHFLLLCAYPMGGFYKQTELRSICAAHDHVVTPEAEGPHASVGRPRSSPHKWHTNKT